MRSSTNKFIYFALIGILLGSQISGAADTTFQTDRLVLNRPNTNNKDIVFSTNNGATKPIIRAAGNGSGLQFSNDGTNFNSFGSGSGSGQGIELLSNPGFENGVTNGWTSTGGTVAAVISGSNLIFGTTTASFLASGSGQKFESSALAIHGLAGASCQATLFYLYGGTSGDYTFEVLDGSSNILGSQALAPNSVAGSPVNLTFPCGSLTTSTLQWIVVSNVASPSTIYLDNAHLGSISTRDVSQAQYIGGTVMTGCAGFWASSTGTPSLPGTQTGCSYAVSGKITAPSTNVPGFTIPNAGPGSYKVIYTGMMANSGSGTSAWFLCSGSNANCASAGAPGSYTNATGAWISTGSTVTNSTGEWSWTQNTSASNLELDLYSQSSATDAQTYGTDGRPGTFLVYYSPTSSQTALGPDQTAASWSGYQNPSGGGWAQTATSFGDPTAAGTVTLTQTTNRNFGTVTNGSGSLPAITVTLPKAGMFKVKAKVNFNISSSGACSPSLRIVDGFGTVIDPGSSQTVPTSSFIATMALSGDYNAASAGAKTFKVQTAIDTGGCTITIAPPQAAGGGAVQWEVLQEDAGQPAPLLTGNVTSSSASSSKIESAHFGGSSTYTSNCTSSPCTLAGNETSWLTSISRSGTGIYELNISAGEFSAAPICTFSCGASGIGNAFAALTTNPTSTSYIFQTTPTAASPQDSFCDVICKGPH